MYLSPPWRCSPIHHTTRQPMNPWLTAFIDETGTNEIDGSKLGSRI
jgi:hypothetical protein